MNLAQIYKENKQGFFTLALSITRSSAEAEDAVHDAFMKLASKKVDVEKPLPYVYMTVRNCALDKVRRRKKVIDAPEFIFDNQVCTDKLPGSDLAEEERNFIIRKELENLPEAQRQVIILKLFSKLTFEQISEVTGEALSTVSSRYARTLKSLKYRMESLV